MRYLKAGLLVFLVFLVGKVNPLEAAGRARPQGTQREEPSRQEDPERAIAQMVREIQMDLEGSSSTSFLGKINAAKFDDFPRFQDMIERLTRQNALRVFFRQVTNVVKEESAQTILDAEMEMTRKESAGQVERRRQQLTLDLERTARGWKIINITPREFFRPL